MYLHTSAHPVHEDMIRHHCVQHYAIAERPRMEGVIIVILCAYCNVFSLVNETWGNLTALHSILHQHCLSSCRWLAFICLCVFMCFGGDIALKSDFGGRVGSYAIKASLILLASPKSPTLPLKFLRRNKNRNKWGSCWHTVRVYSYKMNSDNRAQITWFRRNLTFWSVF